MEITLNQVVVHKESYKTALSLTIFIKFRETLNNTENLDTIKSWVNAEITKLEKTLLSRAQKLGII